MLDVQIELAHSSGMAPAAPAAAPDGQTATPAPALASHQLSLLRPEQEGAAAAALPPAAPPAARTDLGGAAALPASCATPGGRAAAHEAAHIAQRQPLPALDRTSDPQLPQHRLGGLSLAGEPRMSPFHQLPALQSSELHPGAAPSVTAQPPLQLPRQPPTYPADAAALQARVRPGGKAAAFAAATAQRRRAVRDSSAASVPQHGSETQSAESASWSGGDTETDESDGGRTSELISSDDSAPQQRPQKRRRKQRHQADSGGGGGGGGDLGGYKWSRVYLRPDGSVQWAPKALSGSELRIPAPVLRRLKVMRWGFAPGWAVQNVIQRDPHVMKVSHLNLGTRSSAEGAFF